MDGRLELGTGVALAGAAIFSVHAVYTQHAGSLADVRLTPPGNSEATQRLADADALAGGLTLLAGLAISIATGKWYALALAAIAYLGVAWYYHATLNSPPIGADDGTD